MYIIRYAYLHAYVPRQVNFHLEEYLSDDACIYDIDHVMQNIPQNNESIEMIE